MELATAIHLLGALLGDVIHELESPELVETEERIRAAAKERRNGNAQAARQLEAEVVALTADSARVISAAFATYFDLVNLAEENKRIREIRARANALYPEPLNESISHAVAALKQQGVTSEQMQNLLAQLSIELVLTAHPTEARRRSVTSKIQQIARLLDQLIDDATLWLERRKITDSLYAEIAALWLTDRHRTARLAVTDEVRTGLYFVETIFWDVIPILYDDMNRALASYYPEVVPPPNWFRLASWMGGDRDGNPNVTHEATAETLRLHRGLAVEQHRQRIRRLARRLSLSDSRLPPPPEFKAWLDSRRPFPAHVANIEERYAAEPYRLALSLLAADLAEASREEMTARLLQSKPHQARIQLKNLLEPINIIAKRLPAFVARDEIQTLINQLNIFGLGAMRLDIREESTRFNAALGEILRALNLTPNFTTMPEDERLALLTQLLSAPLPELSAHPGVTSAAAETWALFQLVARARAVYGHELIGPVVISMCRSVSDILTVLLLARWTNCDSKLQVVPLFETIEDLNAAPDILEKLFAIPAYRAHLGACANAQMIMIGYSDSNKDGGYVTANWALNQAQNKISRVAKAHQITLTIFHGRGGTIARGGGPANKAIRAQPVGSINGRFRLTEQGETIAARYSNPELAHRHLEQIVHAVLLASSPANPPIKILAEWRAEMESMSTIARQFYRSLVYETPDFADFWRFATPLDEIKRLQIGSRPATRAPSADISKIRAIPWVFSWMQSRFNLPGWFGLGIALDSCKDKALLRDMHRAWPFFTTLLDNVEMSLIKADMEIAALYVDLVPDRDAAKKIFGVIREEYERTREMVLSVNGRANLLEDEPITQIAVQLRNPYVDPLNYIQVEMLRRIRALPDAESDEAQALREVIVLTVNGIAAGLKNTG